jgi:hypothetical protein
LLGATALDRSAVMTAAGDNADVMTLASQFQNEIQPLPNSDPAPGSQAYADTRIRIKFPTWKPAGVRLACR